MMVIGHRGFPTCFTENTILSVKKAIEVGADGVEVDVRISKDGIPVLIHDEDLARVFGVFGRVSELSVRELKELTNGLIPTLQELVEALPSGKLLNVELKEDKEVQKVLEVATKYEGEVVFSSFNLDLLDERLKGKKYGYLVNEENYGTVESFLERVYQVRPYSLHLPYQALSLEVVRKVCEKLKMDLGTKIFVWTLNDPEVLASMRDVVDAVITDEVEKFVKVVKGCTRNSWISGEG